MKNNIKKSTLMKTLLMKTFDTAKKAVLPFAMVAAMATSAEAQSQWEWNPPPYTNAFSTNPSRMSKKETMILQEVFNKYDPKLSNVDKLARVQYENIYEDMADNLIYDLQDGRYINHFLLRNAPPVAYKNEVVKILKDKKTGSCMNFACALSTEFDKLKINNWILMLERTPPNEGGHAANLFEIGSQFFVADLTIDTAYTDRPSPSSQKLHPYLTIEQFMQRKAPQNYKFHYAARFDEKNMVYNRIPLDAFIELHDRLKNDEKFRDAFNEYNRTHPRPGYEKEFEEQKKKQDEAETKQQSDNQETQIQQVNQPERPTPLGFRKQIEQIAGESAQVIKMATAPFLPQTTVPPIQQAILNLPLSETTKQINTKPKFENDLSSNR
ncbi:MAG: hypothetical protein LBU65_06715 [Planctomycetaceae bacterium]|nr:hypothetical protein [Planctomycetaceae bacterium]